MAVRISRAAYNAMIAAAAETPDLEVCGLLFGDGVVMRMQPVANVAADRSRQFEIDPAAYFAAIRAERDGGESLMGYYHSHPSGDFVPSSSDTRYGQGDTRLWVIIAGDKVAAWRMAQSGAFDPVEIQLIDC